MIGDSVTDCERARPIGEGLFEALGKGYVSLVDALLQTSYPSYRIRVVNMGTGGNTVRDLQSRWTSDLLNLNPDWVSVMIGINDCWRSFDTPYQSEWAVPVDEYRRILQSLVSQAREKAKGVIVMSPYFLEPNKAEPMRMKTDEYGAAAREVARETESRFVDIQGAFDLLLRDLHPMAIAWDRVHPNKIGQMLIAKTFVAALEAGE
jgi:Lysophospholipase L1 and related esterases